MPGTLNLCIYCTKCKSYFEANDESLAMSILLNATLEAYLEYVTQSECRVCRKSEGLNKNDCI